MPKVGWLQGWAGFNFKATNFICDRCHCPYLFLALVQVPYTDETVLTIGPEGALGRNYGLNRCVLYRVSVHISK
jgi:hypothetical protein